MCLFRVEKALLLALAVIFFSAATQVRGLDFNFTSFHDENRTQLKLSKNSYIVYNAIQVTPDFQGASIENFSGRTFYKDPFRLRNKGIEASFNTTFVINIRNLTFPGGEGLAFILAADTSLPDNSYGQWLGIVNETTNGTSGANILAVELDTKKSYPEDIDDNHVGLNVNGIISLEQVSLTNYGVKVGNGSDVIATIRYAGGNISIFVSMGNDTEQQTKTPIISRRLDLSFLPEEVFVGFSASTSVNTELNCVKSWQFYGINVGGDKKKPKPPLWVWITVPAVVLLSGIALLMCWKTRFQRKHPEESYAGIEDQIQGYSTAPRKFRFGELKSATGKFSPKNQLGKGGFGTVYRGSLMNKEVAVKRISEDSRQGKQEFIAEVTTIGSLHHKNLVKLIGWCYERRELLLVYEYMPNGSLDRFIYGDEKLSTVQSKLGWEKRHSIICGVAEALDYLHNKCEKRVLHRDIKASNIMLDSEFNARLGDFGLARTIQKKEQTHHSTREIAGTPGYMAPESFLIGRATVETDIYAFGVLVLEVVCGRKPGNPSEPDDYNNSIVHWLWELYQKERLLDAVDSRLNGEFEVEEMECLMILGLACCHPNPHERPSMNTVLLVLTGEVAAPILPNERPKFVWPPMPPSFKDDLDNSLKGGQLSVFTEIGGR